MVLGLKPTDRWSDRFWSWAVGPNLNLKPKPNVHLGLNVCVGHTPLLFRPNIRSQIQPTIIEEIEEIEKNLKAENTEGDNIEAAKNQSKK